MLLYFCSPFMDITMATGIDLLPPIDSYPWYSTTQGAQQSSHSLQEAIWDLLSLQGCWDSLRCARIARLSKQLQLFKMPLKCPLCPACCMAKIHTGSLLGGRHCCSSGKQGSSRYNPRFLMFLSFIPQLPDMFCCYLLLIHTLKLRG